VYKRQTYNWSLIATALGAFAIIYYFIIVKKGSGFKSLVDVATTLSFLVAPFVALANYKLVTNKSFPKGQQPKLWLKVMSILGMVFLVGFSIYGVYVFA